MTLIHRPGQKILTIPPGFGIKFSAPKAAASIFAQSDFIAPNDTSLDAYTPEIGPQWVEKNRDWDIQDNVAHVVLANGYATVDCGKADLTIELDWMREGDTSDSGFFGVLLRYSDNNNFWMAGGDLYADRHYIVERNSGVYTIRAQVHKSVNRGIWYHMKVVAQGTTITSWIDGGSEISYGSATLNQGVTLHGMFAYNRGNGRFDNFIAYPA